MDDSDAHKMIKECLADESDRLTDWEITFLDSVTKQTNLSEKQMSIVQRIWDKLFGG